MTDYKNNTHPEQTPRAVGMISGGLDSTLAAKIIKDLGIDVHGVFFAMPWGCCNKLHAQKTADEIGIKLVTLQLDERYLEIVKKPKHGRGTAMNPCVDCRIHMFGRAAQYMKHIDADFVFTGEVLGQRPMSQKKDAMRIIEENAGLKGRLLRPLCAQLLEPTIPEQEGIVDRNKLLSISGRSRKEQYALAQKHYIADFSAPGGGCLLTDKNFSNRIKDVFQHGYRNFRETIALKWGRHFRMDKDSKVILGRDKEENESLVKFAHRDDIIMQLKDNLGPTLILKTRNPSVETLSRCAGLIQHFSRYKSDGPQALNYWKADNPNRIGTIKAQMPSESFLKLNYI